MIKSFTFFICLFSHSKSVNFQVYFQTMNNNKRKASWHALSWVSENIPRRSAGFIRAHEKVVSKRWKRSARCSTRVALDCACLRFKELIVAPPFLYLVTTTTHPQSRGTLFCSFSSCHSLSIFLRALISARHLSTSIRASAERTRGGFLLLCATFAYWLCFPSELIW